MNYNIYTVLNSEYIKFGKIFLRSLFNTHNINNINNIFILDTGINDNHKRSIKTEFNKIKFINLDDGIIERESDANWTNVVCSKTYYLRKLIEDNKDICPIVMIDIDCLFLKDIEPLIDLDFDFQVCLRPVSDKPLLASFLSFNNRLEAVLLLDKWIEKIKDINKPWKETQALNNIFKGKGNKFKFGFVSLNTVSALYDKDINDKTRIIHFKSSSNQNKRIKIDRRLYRRGLKKYVEKYIKGK